MVWFRSSLHRATYQHLRITTCFRVWTTQHLLLSTQITTLLVKVISDRTALPLIRCTTYWTKAWDRLLNLLSLSNCRSQTLQPASKRTWDRESPSLSWWKLLFCLSLKNRLISHQNRVLRHRWPLIASSKLLPSSCRETSRAQPCLFSRRAKSVKRPSEQSNLSQQTQTLVS